MKVTDAIAESCDSLSAAARRRMEARPGEPLLLADWDRVLMMHFEVDPERLQRETPYELDLWNGRAFVSLVAFTMRGMRFRVGGSLTRWLLWPLATHEFLNVRTYVRCGQETGIHFLAEWLPNPFSVWLGPRTFGLPYRLGRLQYVHTHECGMLSGEVTDARSYRRFAYQAHLAAERCAPCSPGSLDEWLMERYTAFNHARGRVAYFRVWHPPWSVIEADVEVREMGMLEQVWPWFSEARWTGAGYSPGVRDVWMSAPGRITALGGRAG